MKGDVGHWPQKHGWIVVSLRASKVKQKTHQNKAPNDLYRGLGEFFKVDDD